MKEIKRILAQYQEQTCGNFSDINDDMDDLRGYMAHLENGINQMLGAFNEINDSLNELKTMKEGEHRMINNKDIYEKDERGRYIHSAEERQRMIAERVENGTYFDYDPNQEHDDNE